MELGWNAVWLRRRGEGRPLPLLLPRFEPEEMENVRRKEDCRLLRKGDFLLCRLAEEADVSARWAW